MFKFRFRRFKRGNKNQWEKNTDLLFIPAKMIIWRSFTPNSICQQWFVANCLPSARRRKTLQLRL